MQLAGIRLTISSLAFAPWFVLRWKEVDWSKWHWMVVVGLAGSGIPTFLYALAQTRISSSLTGILNSFTPLATLVLGIMFFGMQFRWNKFVGVLAGLSGAFLLIWFNNDGAVSGGSWYGLLIVAGAIFYAISANVVGAHLKDIGAVAISGVAYFLLLPLGASILFGSGVPDTTVTHPHGWQSLGYIIILALASTVLSSILYFKLIKNTNAVFATLVSYFMPIIALMWGVLDGEGFSMISVAGMALILGGVYVAKK